MTPIRLLATAVATLALAASAQAATPGDTLLVSRPSTFGPLTSPTTNNSLSAFSDEGENRTVADGHRYVVFMSNADGLVGDDDNRVINVFVRDRLLKTTRLVSRADGPAGAAANGDSGWATISANGRFVAFASNATNLAPGVSGDAQHIYVRDVISGTTALVDRADGSDGAVGNDDAFDPTLIVTGGNPVIAFTSYATNLDGAAAGFGQIYLRKQGVTTMLSRQNGSSTVAGNGTSGNPAISADGSSVAFESAARNLTAVDPGFTTQIYMRKVGTTTTLPVSWIGLWGDENSSSPTVNKDGTVVAFESDAGNFGDGDADNTTDIHIRDMSVLDMTLGSVRSGVKGNGPSQHPVITDNADALAFTSSATNLSATGDTNGVADVFFRTGLFVTGSTSIVSRNNDGDQADGASSDPSITRNATGDSFNKVWLVVYQSRARNMGPDDEDDFSQVYSHIAGGLVVGGRTSLISRPDGDAPFRSGVNSSTLRPQLRGDEPAVAMSADGRYTVFLSSSDELAADDDNRWVNVFRRDNLTGDTVLVSRANGATGAAANGPSAAEGGGLALGPGGVNGAPEISADGNRIVFASSATNLVPGDANGVADVFVRDVAAGTTVLASRKDDDSAIPLGGGDPAISGDGTKVAFVTRSSLDAMDAGTDADVYLRDLTAGTTRLVSRKGANGPSGNDSSGGPALDADGNRVAFVTAADDFSAIPDTNTSADVWVRDVSAGILIPVSLAAGGAAMANDGGSGPAIDAGGTHVAFSSSSSNIGAPGDVNGGITDIFLRDLAAGSTVLVSRTNGANGFSGNGISERPSIDAAGNRVAFETFASDMVPGDGNGATDVLVRDVGAGTTELVSRGAGAAGAQQARAFSGTPSISGNGQCVAFETNADAFVPMPAGTDFLRVVARALGGGCAFGPVPPPPPPPPPGGGDSTAPVITGAKLKPARFLAGRKVRKAKGGKPAVGAKLRFTLSEAGAVSVRIEKRKSGRRKGTLRKAGVAGRNAVKITGRVKGKKLKPGRYRLKLTVKDAAGNTSKATTIKFRILRP